MRSRFFGASSYDDEDEEETQDFSGFITSSETQPVVIERKRASSSKTEASNMGNAGPKTTAPPPPMTDMGYRPHLRSPVEFKDSGAGNPWNPLWASDDALLKKPAVISKTMGAAGIIAGVAYAIGQKSARGRAGKILAASTALYLHPALGWNHGQIDKMVQDKGTFVQLGAKASVQTIGAVTFYQIIKRA